MKKRDPRNPFKLRSSMIAIAYGMCLQGTTIKALLKLAKSHGANGQRLLWRLRKEQLRDLRWRFVEGPNGKVQIESVK